MEKVEIIKLIENTKAVNEQKIISLLLDNSDEFIEKKKKYNIIVPNTFIPYIESITKKKYYCEYYNVNINIKFIGGITIKLSYSYTRYEDCEHYFTINNKEITLLTQLEAVQLIKQINNSFNKTHLIDLMKTIHAIDLLYFDHIYCSSAKDYVDYIFPVKVKHYNFFHNNDKEKNTKKESELSDSSEEHIPKLKYTNSQINEIYENLIKENKFIKPK